MQCACILYCHVACPALQYFSTLSHKRYGFGVKVIEHKMRVLDFSTTFIWKFLILRRIERDMIKNVYWSSCKVPLILVLFWWHLNFLVRFWKSTQMQNSMKIRSVGADLCNAYRRTGGHNEAYIRFSKFWERAKNKRIFVSVEQSVTVATLI
jgi:hypothetical protein